MPYDIKVRGGKHCVIKRGERNVRPGRCHDTRAQAIKQQRALYAAEADRQSQSVREVTGMSTTGTNPNLTVTFSDGSQVIRFAPVADTEDSTDAEDANRVPWDGVLGIIGDPTSDKRMLLPGQVGHRDFPLPFNVQMMTAEEHVNSVNAGRIETLDLIPKTEFDKEGFDLKDVPDSATVIWGTGTLDNSPAAHEAERMIENGAGVSLDIPPEVREFVDPETLKVVPREQWDPEKVLMGEYIKAFGGKIAGATVVTIPAFEEAAVRLTEDALVASASRLRLTSPRPLRQDTGGGGQMIPDGLAEQTLNPLWKYLSGPDRVSIQVQENDGVMVASAAPLKPPAEWFQNPNLTKLTPLTITKEGRVYGHLADWDGCHTGFSSICVPPFRSLSNYAYFNVAPFETAEGELIKVGKLMYSRDGVGHAPTEQWTTAEDASKHYDDATNDAANVVAGADRFGTWLAGALVPGLSEEDVQFIRSHPPSGDWRPSPRWAGSELIAAFCVSVPGFPIAQSLVASGVNGELTIITAPLSLEIGPRALARQKLALKARRQMALAHFELEPESEEFQDVTAEDRRRMAKSGVAMPDGSFPIPDCDHAERAIRAQGRAPASKRPRVVAHIRKRVRALGCSGTIFDNYK